MLNIFFAPRVKSDYFIEQMLIDACVHDCSHRIGENIVENYSHKFYFSRLSTYKNIIKAVTAYVISITNIQSLVHYELDGVNIGRPAYAAALLNY